MAFAVSLASGAIVALVLWDRFPRGWLLLWWGGVAVTAMGCYWWSRDPGALHREPALRWEHCYLGATALHGALWGAAGVFLFVGQDLALQMFLSLVLVVVATGAAITLAPLRGAPLVFLLPALGSYAAGLLAQGGAAPLATAAALALYVALLTALAEQVHHAWAETRGLRPATPAVSDRARCLPAAGESAGDHQALERLVMERTEQLARSERALREANRRKDEFLAILAHELRNPLGPIRNAVEVMRRPNLPEATLSWARSVIDRQVDHLSRLVNDLLDVSRIVQGKFLLQESLLDPALVIERAVEASRPRIEARQHRLTVTLPEQMPRIRGDLLRLAQVVSNLLDNAAKYTDAGGNIWLTVTVAGDGVAIRVRDNGLGIPPEALPRIFDLFSQADRSPDRTQGGLGIGLSLVRRLVELHGGRVEAHSEGPGRGAEFVVWLPCATRPE
ncbi:MFS domain-containing histidine kinase [Candidatus Methylocalor cossyra]